VSVAADAGVRWLAAGAVTGALVTLGAVILVAGVVREDPPPPAAGPPRFVEETATAGVDQVYDGGFTFFVGGGVAVLDCDGDRLLDLYVAGGTNQAGLYRNQSPTGGALRFAQLPGAATDLASVTGAYPLDVDSDGITDLAVLRLGGNVLLRGLGDCRFERANEAWSVDGGDAWTVAFSATWEGRRSLPTMAFGNYVALTPEGRRAGGCSDHVLLRPEGPEGGRYGPPTTLSPGWCTLSILFSDWDRSGRRDLRMTNDRHYYRDGEEQLWRVAEGEPPRPYTRAEGWQPMQIWGMGIASQDLTGDGTPEVYLTSQGDNKLQQLAGGPSRPTYSDIAFRRGATAHRPYAGDVTKPSTAWHPEFQDVNNDGYVDLLVTKGNVEAQPEYARRDPDNLLLGQADGSFAEAAQAAGIVDFARGRGAALADLNLDGLLDLVEVNRREPVKVWRNAGSGGPGATRPMGNWVALRLRQPAPNPDAIGAWIELRAGGRTQRRELTVGGGHAGGQLGWVHFGLGDSDRVEVRVRWPDGQEGPWMEAAANQFLTIERGAGEVAGWNPAARPSASQGAPRARGGFRTD
jgi:enediyne biosynthesis protein E4